jgi:hypothetical protein
LIRGRLRPEEYERELASTRDYLATQAKAHLTRFLDAWKTTGASP